MTSLVRTPILLGFVLCSALFQTINSNSLITHELFFEDDHEAKRRKVINEERELSHFRRNLTETFGSPTVALEPIEVLHNLLKDPARRYIGKLCHMESWQFFLLADRLRPLIEKSILLKFAKCR